MLKLLKYTPQELAEYIKDKDCKVYIWSRNDRENCDP